MDERSGIRESYVVRDGKLVPKSEAGPPRPRGPMVMSDSWIDYRSTIDGSRIAGRRQHRDHLREHGCTEVGNEKMPPKAYDPVPGLVDDIKRAYAEHGFMD